ncbi:TPA: hypothetical protein ACPVXB_001019 [Vibrio parahaemolyticus]
MSHINISLSANTASYVQRLKDAKTQTDRNIILMEKRIDKFAKDVNANFTSVNGAIDTMLSGLGAIKGGGYVAAIGALGISAGVIAANFHQLATSALASEQELTKASTRAGMSHEAFKVLAMSVSTVGISLEKMGDISKDVFDRIGDYATAGAGALQDFFDIVGEGNVALKDLEDLNSIEVLQKMVVEMEAVGASGAQMVFALESIASDASDLLPLLVNNSEGLKELQTRMSEIAQTPLFNKDTIIEMQVMEQNWNSLWDNFGAVAAHELTGLYGMINSLLTKINESLISIKLDSNAKDIIKQTGNAVGGNGGEAFKANTKQSLQHQEQDSMRIARAIELLEISNKQVGLDTKTHKARVAHNNKVIAQLKEQKDLLDASVAEGKKLEKEKWSNVGGTNASQIWDLNNKKESLDLLEDDVPALLKAKEELRVAEINQMKIDADLKKKLIEKAAEDRKDAELKHYQDLAIKKARIDADVAQGDEQRLEAQRALAIAQLDKRATEEELSKKQKAELLHQIDKDFAIKELALLQKQELDKAQLRLDSAITNQERIEAQHALEQVKLAQRFENEVVAYSSQQDLLFNSEYQHIKDKAALKAEGYLNDHQAQIAQAEIVNDWLLEQREANRISEEEYNSLSLEHKKAITEGKVQLLMAELGAAEQALSGISNLAKEGSTAQKALFAVEKSATLAKLGMQMWEAWGNVDSDPTLITQASKLTAKAGVLAQYGGAMAQVASSVVGQAHSGMDEVDQTGSYILKKGERIVQETANKDLTSYLKSNANSQSNSSQTVNAPLNISGDANIDPDKFQTMLYQHRESVTAAMRAAQRENPSLR